jgi:hypothetical protein
MDWVFFKWNGSPPIDISNTIYGATLSDIALLNLVSIQLASIGIKGNKQQT